MKRKNDVFSQAVVGVFMIALIVMMGFFTIAISGFDIFSARNRVEVQITFDQVGGLKDHDNVMYRGTKVGTVEYVEVSSTNLIVHALIDDNVVMRTGYRIMVCNTSMLGGTFLQLEEGAGDKVEITKFMFHGETPTDWMQEVAKISRNIQELTSRPELTSIITNVNAVSFKARAIADKMDRFMDHLQVAVEKTNGFMDKADSAAGHINSIAAKVDTEKEAVIADFRAGVQAFRAAAEGFDIKDTMAKADVLLGNLNVVAENLKEGKGTLGRLNNDPKLYDEINGLIRDVRQVIDNYRDTTPISTFSSLAAGAL